MAIREKGPGDGREGGNDRNLDGRGTFERLLALLVDPGGTFKAIVEKPDFVGPVILIILAAALSIPGAMHAIKEMPESQPGQAPSIPVSSQVSAIIASVSTLITLLVWWPIRAAVFMGTGAILGSRLDFRSSLAVSGYLNYSTFLASLVSAVTILTVGKPVTPGFGMTLPTSELMTPRGVFLSNLNIFTAIYVFLSIFGLSALWKTSKAKALLATAIMWVIVLAIQVAGASIAGGLRGITA
ncbi:MAG TPA: YIP1 family protein [Firmicutes bacterium]|nr:YIP1 family protein [Bacillota bacterium]